MAVTRVYGLDFSGGVMAGRKIWIAAGEVRGDRLAIAECFRAEALPGSGPERGPCLAALRSFIAGLGSCAIGCDFPFSLSAALIAEATWEGFVYAFADRFPTAAGFLEACRAATPGVELRRGCDRVSRTPFSAYNVRMFRQTHAGIAGMLAPLLRSAGACVLPFQAPVAGKPWLLEVCPASTLKHLGLYHPYKGRTPAHRATRANILTTLTRDHGLDVAGPLVEPLLRDDEGDALDSVIAALATHNVLRDSDAFARSLDACHALEGFVYA